MTQQATVIDLPSRAEGLCWHSDSEQMFVLTHGNQDGQALHCVLRVHAQHGSLSLAYSFPELVATAKCDWCQDGTKLLLVPVTPRPGFRPDFDDFGACATSSFPEGFRIVDVATQTCTPLSVPHLPAVDGIRHFGKAYWSDSGAVLVVMCGFFDDLLFFDARTGQILRTRSARGDSHGDPISYIIPRIVPGGDDGDSFFLAQASARQVGCSDQAVIRQ